MGLFSRLFGSTRSDEVREIEMLGEDDAKIRVKPKSVSHAFVALSHPDMDHGQRLGGMCIDLNRQCHPDLWAKEIHAKCVTFSTDPVEGYPDTHAIGPTLERQGLADPYSIAINTVVVTLDGGRTETRILVGFAWKDRAQRIVVAPNGGFVAG